MKSALFNVAIFGFFLDVILFPSYKKSVLNDPYFNLCWTFVVILAKYAISTSSDYLSAQNMGHNQLKTCSK